MVETNDFFEQMVERLFNIFFIKPAEKAFLPESLLYTTTWTKPWVSFCSLCRKSSNYFSLRSCLPYSNTSDCYSSVSHPVPPFAAAYLNLSPNRSMVEPISSFRWSMSLIKHWSSSLAKLTSKVEQSLNSSFLWFCAALVIDSSSFTIYLRPETKSTSESTYCLIRQLSFKVSVIFVFSLSIVSPGLIYESLSW